MKRHISIFLLVLALLPAVGIMAQEHRQRLAILDPVMSDADDGMKLVVREIVSSVFVNNGDKYTILERSLLDKVMQEAKFSNTGAVDEAQATELGKLAGADKIVLTVVSKVGTRCMLSIKLINVETATIEKQHSKVVKYESLLDVIEPLTLAVLGKASEEQLATVDTPEPTAPAAAPAAPAAAPEEPAAPEKKKGLLGALTSKKNTSKPAAAAPSAAPRMAPLEECMWFKEAEYTTTERFIDEFRPTDLYELYGTTPFVSIVFDFSKAYIDGVPGNRYLELNQHAKAKKDLTFREELDTYLPEVMQRFKDALGDELKDFRFSLAPGSPYTLVVRMLEVDKAGRENTSEFIFFNQNGQSLGGISMKSKGGRFGGFTNLMGDAYEEEAAPELAKAVKKQMKVIKKRSKR